MYMSSMLKVTNKKFLSFKLASLLDLIAIFRFTLCLCSNKMHCVAYKMFLILISPTYNTIYVGNKV